MPIKIETVKELRDHLNELIKAHGENLPVWTTEEASPNVLREISDISYVDSLVNGKFIHLEL
jgi:hypothetical protein